MLRTEGDKKKVVYILSEEKTTSKEMFKQAKYWKALIDVVIYTNIHQNARLGRVGLRVNDAGLLGAHGSLTKEDASKALLPASRTPVSPSWTSGSSQMKTPCLRESLAAFLKWEGRD